MKKLTEIYEASVNPKDPNGFCILKPGFTQYQDEFLGLLNNNGWKVLQKDCRKLTRDEVEQLYQNKKDAPFYQGLCDYMICDDCLCCACHKNCDDPINDMESLKKKVREQWGEDDMRNAMHSADSLDNVIRECKIAFKKVNEWKSQELDTSWDEKNLSEEALKNAGFGSSFMDDRSWIVIDNKEYNKIGEDTWQGLSLQAHALSGTLNSKALFELWKKSSNKKIGQIFKNKIVESLDDDQRAAQQMVDRFAQGTNTEIDKITPDAIISIIRNNEQFGYTMPLSVKDEGDFFTLKFDVNDFLTHNKVSTVIPNIAKFFKEAEGSPKVDVDIRKYTLKIYKTTADIKESIDEAQEHELAIKEDISDIIELLKCAFCEEMNAWYQYIIIAPFLQGPNMGDIEDFYKEAAKDELEDHGYSILKRLKILGATDHIVDLNIVDSWNQFAEHKYIVPTSDFDTVTSLEQNIAAERGAIETYTKLVEISRDRDVVTNELAKHILADEQEHLQKLQDLLVEAQS